MVENRDLDFRPFLLSERFEPTFIKEFKDILTLVPILIPDSVEGQ